MEEKAFQVPDGYMLTVFNQPNQPNHWCTISNQVQDLAVEFPYENRENKAFFHGAGSGAKKAAFSYEDYPLSPIYKK